MEYIKAMLTSLMIKQNDDLEEAHLKCFSVRGLVSNLVSKKKKCTRMWDGREWRKTRNNGSKEKLNYQILIKLIPLGGLFK